MNDSDIKDGTTATFGPVLVFGFLTSVVMWCVWFVTHLPGLGLIPAIRGVLLLLAMVATLVQFGRLIGAGRGALLGGLGTGALSGCVNLFLLGSALTEPAPAGSNFRPHFAVFVAGFLILSALTGAIAAAIGGLLPSRREQRPRSRMRWLFRFSLVAIAAVSPVILLGGLVTSTESGMSVPDWPTTYGANMFLYPINVMTQHRVFIEHSHRLFGSLAGLTMIVLMVYTLTTDRRRFVKIWSVGLLALVVLQGLLGAERVLGNSLVLAIVHGVIAQLFLAMTVVLAVFLAPTFIEGRTGLEPSKRDRLLRTLTTGLLHASILQLILGAVYRHLSATQGQVHKGAMHVLYAHAGFALVVTIFAVAAGFLAAARGRDAESGVGPILRRLGVGLVVVVALQLALGIAALVVVLLAGRPPGIPLSSELATTPDVPLYEVLITTAHQANGALLLCLAAAAFTWTRWIGRRQAAAADGTVAAAPA